MAKRSASTIIPFFAGILNISKTVSLSRIETEPIRYQMLYTMSTRRREENKNNPRVAFTQQAHRLLLLGNKGGYC
eukprot:768054-Hanusia_phi.AAC.3